MARSAQGRGSHTPRRALARPPPPGSLVASLLSNVAGTLAGRMVQPFGPQGASDPFAPTLFGRMTSTLHVDLVLYFAILGAGYAFDYYRRFRERALRADRLRTSSSSTSGNGRTLLVPVAEIDWIEAEDYYVRVHARGRSHLLRRSLNDLEEELDPGRFVRVHRSALVNVERVRQLRPLAKRDVVLDLEGGREIRLSRTYRERLLEALGRR